jgi:hypothetical protein
MFRQYGAWEWFDFTKRHGFKATSALQPKAEATDAAEEIKHLEHGHSK